MSTVEVKEVSIDTAVEVNKTIVEFDAHYPKSYFEDRYQGHAHLIIVGYDHDQDGSFYCWMAGVNPNYRRQGVLSALMRYQAAWAKQHGYTTIKIKTRNNRREMLASLVKHGFLFTEVVTAAD